MATELRVTLTLRVGDKVPSVYADSETGEQFDCTVIELHEDGYAVIRFRDGSTDRAYDLLDMARRRRARDDEYDSKVVCEFVS